jgi:Glycosyl hydrolase family 26
MLVYQNHVVWQQAWGLWWSWVNNSWQPTGGTTTDPRSASKPAESANGLTVPPATSITDANGVSWTLVASAKSGNQIAKNGVVDPITGNVTQLVYVNHVIWQQAVGLWWSWVNNAWTAGVTNSPLATPTPTPVAGSGGMLVGVYMDPPDSPTWSAMLSKKPDYTINNSTMTINNVGSNPCNALNNNGNGGYPTVAGVGHFNTGVGGNNDPVAAANGSYNSDYANYAANVIGPCANSLYALRIDQEWSGNWFPWGPYASPGSYGSPYISPADWIAGFRHLVDAIRANPATAHIKISWDYPLQLQGANTLSYYPGDAYVDIIGTDLYAQPQFDGPTGSGAWTTFLASTGGLNDMAAFAAAHNKPMAIWEWCDVYTDGVFLTNFSNWMKANNVVAQSYWDSNDAIGGGGACRLQDSASRQAAYIAAWKGWQYSGTYWGSTTLPIPAAGYPGY